MFRRLISNRGLGINLLAGLSFLLLAIYGWGLSWELLVQYLLIIIGLSVVLASIAALLVFGLRRWTKSRNSSDARRERNKRER